MHTVLPLLLLSGCGSCGGPVEDTQDVIGELSGERNVVVLVLDGVRMEESFGDGYSDAAGMNTEDIMPTIRETLLPQGTLIKPAYATGITITAPGHSDMITGVRQTFANYPNDLGIGAYVPELPTLFEELRAQHGVPQEQVIMAANSLLVTPLQRSTYPGYAGLGAEEIYIYDEDSAISDPKALLQLREEIEARQPRLLIANLHDIDRVAHSGAVEGYGEQAQDFDSVLVDFWDWLSALPGYGADTVLVITSDHGRHRSEEIEEFWRGHGDQCSGCREIPMFLVGPGIKADTVIESPHTLPDLTATLAWLLETDLPHGEGVVMVDALEEPPEKSADRAGVVYPSVADGMTAVQRWHSTEPRSTIEVDGTTLSSQGIFAAERPRMASTSIGTVACWRELTIEPGAEFMPWYGTCQLNDGSGWTDMTFPEVELFPLWAPTIRQDADGALWMAMVRNPTGIIGDDTYADAHVWILGYQTSTASWELYKIHDNGGAGLIFPTDVRFVVSDRAFTVAYATSTGDASGRHTRRIDLYTAEKLLKAGTTFEPLLSIGPSSDKESVLDFVVEADRLERPALWQSGDGALQLGFLAYDVDGTINILATSSSAGAGFSEPEVIDESGRALPHVDPTFSSSGALLWAELSESDTVRLCSHAAGDTTCTDTGAAYIMGFDEDAGTITASVRQDATADWGLLTLEL